MLRMCENNDYILDADTRSVVRAYLEESVTKKDENFANGRMVRNLYDDLVMNHARRVATMESPTREDLSTIVNEDFKLVKEQESHFYEDADDKAYTEEKIFGGKIGNCDGYRDDTIYIYHEKAGSLESALSF